jgi:CheY-like chemotaxis protein
LRDVSLLILVVDDEPDVELLFRQQFRRDLRAGRFVMEFAASGHAALQRVGDAEGVSLILILSDINMPGMTLFVDNLASDETCDQAKYDPAQDAYFGFPCIDLAPPFDFGRIESEFSASRSRFR